MIERLLASLRGISGVDGALIATRSGVIIASDFNALYTPELMEGILRGLGYMFQEMPEHLGAHDDAVLEFEERILFVRRKDGFVIVVLAFPHTEVDSLRVASNLLVAHIKRAQVESSQEMAASQPATAKAPPQQHPAHLAQQKPEIRPPIKKRNSVAGPGSLSQRIKR